MDDRDEKELMKTLYTDEKFPFTYDGIIDNNPNSDHDIKEFW